MLFKSDSPENLDTQIKLLKARDWLLWAAITALIIVALLWSIFGTVYTRVQGKGIILPQKGVIYRAVSPSRGLLAKLYIKPGQTVQKNEIIAVIDQSDLQEKINLHSQKLNNLLNQELRIVNQVETHKLASGKQTVNLLKFYRLQYKNDKQYTVYLSNLLKKQRSLLKNSFISEREFEALKRELHDVQESMYDVQAKISGVTLNEEQNKQSWYEQLISLEKEINREVHSLSELYLNLEKSSFVLSPAAGKVLEMHETEGEFMHEDATIAVVAESSKNRKVVAFFSPYDGKKLKDGFKTYISPSTVKKEEFGAILGKVHNVMPYPLSFNAATNLIHNPDLAKILTGAEGVSIVADIYLKPDSNTVSKLAWTSTTGPSFTIGNGTICEVSVLTKTQAPIVLAFTFLKGLFNEN